MDKFAKIRATLRGEDLGELPVSLWHHFPVDDLHAERLVKKELAFQERFDSDFMKFSPSGAYPYIAFGAEGSTILRPKRRRKPQGSTTASQGSRRIRS
jgi:hypothetical protein